MGVSLCCMRPSQPDATAIIKSPTSKKRVFEAKKEEERVDSGSTTLKDWLVNSPNNNLVHHATNPTKRQNINARSPSPQVMSSPEVRSSEFYTPRISFSSDNRYGKLLKVDERDEDEDEESSSTPILKGDEGQKLKKKVSFRFPQEADIFIFYSPKQNFEDN